MSRAQRAQHQLQRLAEPGRAGPVVRDAVVLAVRARRRSRRSAARTISTYSRVFPSGLPHGWPCQPSTTCGPDVPRPEQEAAAGDEVERRRRHRRVRGRAAGDLHDRRAELDAARLRRRSSASTRDRVGAPRLGRPRPSRSRAAPPPARAARGRRGSCRAVRSRG